MELRQLRYFLAVAEELHFGKAAERVFIAQSPLSRQIRQLEEELGVQLFRRTKRSVELTDAGRALVPEAEAILSATRRARDTAIGAKQGRIGRLTIGFTNSALYTPFPRILRTFATVSPLVELQFLERMLTPDQVQAITGGRMDIGVLRPPVPSSEIELLPLASETLVAVIPESSALARCESLQLEELAQERFITFSRSLDSSLARAVLALFHRRGFQPNIAHEVKEISTIVMLVASGLGVALVPSSAEGLRQEGVVFRPIAGEEPALSIALAWNRNMRSSARDEFLRVAREVLSGGVRQGPS